MQETGVQYLDRKDLLEKWQSTPVVLPGKSHEWRIWRATVQRVTKELETT